MGPRTEIVDLDGTDARSRVPGRTRAPGGRRGRPVAVRPARPPFPRGLPAPRSRRTRRSIRTAEWILGGGWSMDVFPGGVPTKDLLDAVVPDRIVFLPNRDGHSTWVNSRAFELAGVTRETPDPADGRIERDADGEPSGTLHEGAVGPRRPAGTPTDGRRDLRGAAPGPAVSAFAGDHRLAGRDRVQRLLDGQLHRVPPCRRQRRSHRPCRGGALVGSRPR